MPGTILVQKKRKKIKQDSTTTCNRIPSYLLIFLHFKNNYSNFTADFVERKFKIFLLVPSCSKCVKVLHYKMSKLKKTFQTFPFNFSVIFQLIKTNLYQYSFTKCTKCLKLIVSFPSVYILKISTNKINWNLFLYIFTEIWFCVTL